MNELLLEEFRREAYGTPAWIPVSERLPENDVTVLAALDDKDWPVWLAFHDAEGWFSVDAGPIEVTHWMPLPASPTEVS